MAYGISSTTFLLSTGLTPAVASASVHIGGVFTMLASGLSHWKLKNINIKILKNLIIPGVIGAITGAFVLTSVPSETIKIFVNIYLIIMGIRILYKVFKTTIKKKIQLTKIWLIGVIGGFLDSIGGGGWGPIVTSTFIIDGYKPSMVIGTSNTAKFFVTLAQSVVFIVMIDISKMWQVILGLSIGGIIAAPIAALISKKIPAKAIMILVGIVIIVINLWDIVKA